jgi:hypothetical protein
MKKRSCGSIKVLLLQKSREAALSAVQIFNNPNITFKSETYIVLMIIAWTYLHHAFFKEHKIDYRYRDTSKSNGKKVVYKKREDDYLYWDLSHCIKHEQSPLSEACKNNLKFLIGLRNKVEHKMIKDLDDAVSARLQACCLNFNKYIKELFGEKYSIHNHLTFSLQFSKLNTEQRSLIKEYDLPETIESYIEKFDSNLKPDEYNNDEFAIRYLFVPKQANRIGQADKAIEFLKKDSTLTEELNKQYVISKEVEKPKFKPKKIVSMMKELGFNFAMKDFTTLWQNHKAKGNQQYGVFVSENNWYWYQTWVDKVKKECEENRENLK